VLEEESRGKTIVLTGPWSDEPGEILMSGKADGLTLNYARGFTDGSLEFLDPGWRLRRFDLLDRSIVDLSPVCRLSDSLEELSIQAAPEAELDLAPLTRLRSVAGPWWLLRATLAEVVDLRSLITWEFDEPDLRSIRDHVRLQRLTIKDAPSLESLSGTDGLTDLIELRIQGARRLRDISDLMWLADSLAELWLQECRNLEALDEIEPLGNLQVLNVGNCGPIESVAPLARLKRLEYLSAWGTTQVLDGDLMPLVRLPALREVRMRDRRDYQPRLGSFVLNAERIRE
jgi:hypothetical protein